MSTMKDYAPKRRQSVEVNESRDQAFTAVFLFIGGMTFAMTLNLFFAGV